MSTIPDHGFMVVIRTGTRTIYSVVSRYDQNE